MKGHIVIPKIESKVKHKIIKLPKQFNLPEKGKLSTISKDFTFGNAGLMLRAGNIHKSKTNDIFKHC
jgi:hypothetical protein